MKLRVCLNCCSRRSVGLQVGQVALPVRKVRSPVAASLEQVLLQRLSRAPQAPRCHAVRPPRRPRDGRRAADQTSAARRRRRYCKTEAPGGTIDLARGAVAGQGPRLRPRSGFRSCDPRKSSKEGAGRRRCFRLRDGRGHARGERRVRGHGAPRLRQIGRAPGGGPAPRVHY